MCFYVLMSMCLEHRLTALYKVNIHVVVVMIISSNLVSCMTRLVSKKKKTKENVIVFIRFYVKLF